MRNHGRVDDNHAAIVKAFRRIPGVLVADMSGVGHGIPDLLILNRGRIMMVEIKDGSKPPSRRKLTRSQLEFISLGWPVSIVTSEAEAMELLGWTE